MIRLSTLLAAYLACLLVQVPVTGALLQSFGSAAYGALDVGFFCAMALLVLKSATAPILSPTARAIGALFVYAGLSSFWSASLDVSYGLALLARDLLRFLNVVAAAALLSPHELRKAIVRAVAAAALLYPAMALATMSLAFDSPGGEGRLMYAGYKDANPVARDLAVMLMLAYWGVKSRLLRSSLVVRLNMVLLAILFLVVFSKTTTVALLAAFATGAFFYRSRLSRKVQGVVVAVALLAGVVALKLDYLVQYLTEVQSGFALETLSGRTLIWGVALERVGTQALFGFGLNSFGAFALGTLDNIPQQAHNELLQIAFSYGVPGFVLMLWIWSSFLAGRKKAPLPEARLIAAVCVFYIVVGLTEANIVTTIAPVWLLTLLSYLPPRVSARAEGLGREPLRTSAIERGQPGRPTETGG